MMTPKQITQGKIREIVEQYGVTADDLLSTRRPRVLLAARVELAEHLRGRGYSLQRIGRVMNRDHSTVSFYLGRHPSRSPSPRSMSRPWRPPAPTPTPEPEPRRPIRYAGWEAPQHDHR